MAKTTPEKDLPESGLPAIVAKAPGTSRKKPVVPVTDPMPVVIADVVEPVPVVIEQPEAQKPVLTSAGRLTLPPTTTEAADRVTEGQRHINRVWEYSQAAIALMITGAIVYTSINGISSDNLSNGFFLIIGFYFSRVNHQAIGGVGPKPPELPYTGR